GFGKPRFERRPLPRDYPTIRAIDPASPLVAALRRSSGALLELPLGPMDVLPPLHARAMYRSIFHWRPLLNGYDSYYPPGFPERMALAARLPDPQALAELRGATGLEEIVVQMAEIRDPARRAEWLAIAAGGERSDLELVARDGDDLLFRVRPRPPADSK